MRYKPQTTMKFLNTTLSLLFIAFPILAQVRPLKSEDVWRIRQYNDALSMHLVNEMTTYKGLLIVGTQDAVDIVAPATYQRMNSFHYKLITKAAMNTFRGERVFLCPMEKMGCIIVADASGLGFINIDKGFTRHLRKYSYKEKCRGIYPISNSEFLVIKNDTIENWKFIKSKDGVTNAERKEVLLKGINILCTGSATNGKKVWIVANNSVYSYDLEKPKQPLTLHSALPAITHFDRYQRAIIRGYRQGYVFAKGHKFIVCTSPSSKVRPEAITALPDNDLEILDLEPYSSQLLLATDKGLYIHAQERNEPFPVTDRELKIVDQFTALMLTPDGVLAIGTRSSGVLTINTSQAITLQPHLSFPKDNHYVKNYARSMAHSTKPGIVFLGTDDSQILVFDLKANKILDSIRFKYTEIRALADDSLNNAIFAGTRHGKVYRIKYEIKDGYPKIVKKSLDSTLVDTNVQAGITSLYFEGSSSLWAGTNHGLFKIHNHNGPRHSMVASRIGSDTLDVRFVTQEGTRLLIASNAGLWYLKGERLLAFKYLPKDSLNAIHITHFIKTPGSKNQYFLSTRSDGLLRVRIKGDSIKLEHQYTGAQNGLAVYGQPPIYLVYSSLFDQNHRLWASTNHGLFRLDDLQSKDALFTWFGYKDLGLKKPAEFNTGSFTKGGDSILLFGSRGGFVEVRSNSKGRLFHGGVKKIQFWKYSEDGNGLYVPANKTNEVVLPNFGLQQYNIVLEGFKFEGQPSIAIVNTYHEINNLNVLVANTPFEILQRKHNINPAFNKLFNIYLKSNQNQRLIIKRRTNALFWIIAGVVILFSILGLVIMEVKIKNKEVKIKNKELKSKNQVLEFIQIFAKELREAKSYEDIDSIFNEPKFKKLLSTGLNSDQIAVTVYDKSYQKLDMVAYALPDKTDISPSKKYYLVGAEHEIPESKRLEFEEDQNRPIVKMWKDAQYKKDKVIEVNDAETEFYQKNKFKRTIPILGYKSESFIFMPIHIGKEKELFGIITIQNSQAGVYTKNKDREKRHRFEETVFLEIIRDNTALAINRLYIKEQAELTQTEIEMHHRTYKWISSHFIGNYLSIIKKNILILNDPKRATRLLSRLNEFLHKIFSPNLFSQLWDELELADIYVNKFLKLYYEESNYSFNLQYDENVQAQFGSRKMPSMLLLNVINNSIEHNRKDYETKREFEIRLSIELIEGKNLLALTVEDNGTGEGEKSKLSRTNEVSFLTYTKNYFKKLNDLHSLPLGEQFSIEHAPVGSAPGYKTTLLINTKVFANANSK